jgi:hypothetical protein
VVAVELEIRSAALTGCAVSLCKAACGLHTTEQAPKLLLQLPELARCFLLCVRATLNSNILPHLL